MNNHVQCWFIYFEVDNCVTKNPCRSSHSYNYEKNKIKKNILQIIIQLLKQTYKKESKNENKKYRIANNTKKRFRQVNKNILFIFVQPNHLVVSTKHFVNSKLFFVEIATQILLHTFFSQCSSTSCRSMEKLINNNIAQYKIIN